MQTGKKVRDWEKFLRALDRDPVQTVITHLTEQPPIVHLFCKRKSYNLSLEQIRALYNLGRLPASVIAFLIIRGVLTGAPPTTPSSQESAEPLTESPLE